VERDRIAKTGPNASKVYSRASVIRFLENRFLGVNPAKN